MTDAPAAPPPHHRDRAVSAAMAEVMEFARPWAERHVLTAIEFLQIFLTVSRMAAEQASRTERAALVAAEAKQAAETPAPVG